MKNQVKIIFSVLGLMGCQCYGNLVMDGSFQNGTVAPWTLAADDFDTGVATAFDYLPPAGDTYFLYFGQVGSDAMLSQTIATTAGHSYTFSFAVIGNGSGNVSDLHAYWNGALVYTIANPVPNQGWTPYNLTVTATGPTTVVSFGLRNDPSYDGLDNISVTPAVGVVPEPTTMLSAALMLLPFGSGAVRQFRKKLQAA
jgi:hypothetical protein